MYKVVTCTAPVNIAVIKYWGKRDEKLILPINDSISVTLSSKHMHAKTSVCMSADFKSDRLWLNGQEESVETNQRLLNCLREVRKRAVAEQTGASPDWKVHINSENNFPTAAGLASSAAGYACLVYALCQLYNVKGDISSLARQGSGSACRSVYGGFVRWHMGQKEDGSDSLASVVEEAEHWPDMRCLILVANDSRKKVASSVGMKTSTETSEFLKFRAKHIVPERTETMAKAIKEKDFDTFAELTMKDSNSLHSVCLDTFPPCVYMNQVSHSVIELVHKINAVLGDKDDKYKVAYSFDAGPNACLFLRERDVPAVLSIVKEYFPGSETETQYVRGEPSHCPPVSEDIKAKIGLSAMPKGSLKYIISTGIGFGPERLANGHLLDANTGLPIEK